MVLLLRPDRARIWTRTLQLSEEELLLPACARLVPALIQAAGPKAARAHGAVVAALVEGMTPPVSNAARQVTSLSAATAALLRAFCEASPAARKTSATPGVEWKERCRRCSTG